MAASALSPILDELAGLAAASAKEVLGAVAAILPWAYNQLIVMLLLWLTQSCVCGEAGHEHECVMGKRFPFRTISRS